MLTVTTRQQCKVNVAVAEQEAEDLRNAVLLFL